MNPYPNPAVSQTRCMQNDPGTRFDRPGKRSTGLQLCLDRAIDSERAAAGEAGSHAEKTSTPGAPHQAEITDAEVPVCLQEICRMFDVVQSLQAMAWRTERSGEFGSYSVSGWRYAEIPVWHVSVSMNLYDKPERKYVVRGENFFPDTASASEKNAALHLISVWEAAGLDRPGAQGLNVRT
jgi:hypothetical protein